MDVLKMLMDLEVQGVKVFLTAAGGEYLAQRLGAQQRVEQGVAAHG